MTKTKTACFVCGTLTTNKQFCSGACRKMHNAHHQDNNARSSKRSLRGLRG